MKLNFVPLVGSIQLVYFDGENNDVVPIGGASFITRSESDRAWSNVPETANETDFMADRLDAAGVITDDRKVTARTCEILMGKPIAELIAAGRARLALDKAQAFEKIKRVREMA